MAIGTDDAIWKFGTQDQVDSTAGTVANDTFSVAGDVDSTWTNDDDAPFGSAVLKCQFDTTAPTVGSIGLYARLLNIEGTNDENEPDTTNNGYSPNNVGTFLIDFGVANDVDMYLTIATFSMPQLGPAQAIEWYIKNEGTSQTIGTGWNLWITPKSLGPKA